MVNYNLSLLSLSPPSSLPRLPPPPSWCGSNSSSCLAFAPTGALSHFYQSITGVVVPTGFFCMFFQSSTCTSCTQNSGAFIPAGSWNMSAVPGVSGLFTGLVLFVIKFYRRMYDRERAVLFSQHSRRLSKRCIRRFVTLIENVVPVEGVTKKADNIPFKVGVVGVTHVGPGRQKYHQRVLQEVRNIRSILKSPPALEAALMSSGLGSGLMMSLAGG
ncbi:hypothetical protein B0H13DRAFT_1887462 [Mycena leptocephala]|nr:hypothetical protein B0H13DRAFT_1887462 [Mycena leptocephala]